jgi:hypothetical protein
MLLMKEMSNLMLIYLYMDVVDGRDGLADVDLYLDVIHDRNELIMLIFTWIVLVTEMWMS